MNVDSRTTEGRVDSTFESQTPGRRNQSQSRGRGPPRAGKGGIPTPRYSMDEILQGLNMSATSREELKQT
eukprot:7295910-Karenia_brevis.AAC.1